MPNEEKHTQSASPEETMIRIILMKRYKPVYVCVRLYSEISLTLRTIRSG